MEPSRRVMQMREKMGISTEFCPGATIVIRWSLCSRLNRQFWKQDRKKKTSLCWCLNWKDFNRKFFHRNKTRYQFYSKNCLRINLTIISQSCISSRSTKAKTIVVCGWTAPRPTCKDLNMKMAMSTQTALLIVHLWVLFRHHCINYVLEKKKKVFSSR